MLELIFAIHNSSHCHLKQSKDEKAEELQEQGNFVFEGSSTGVITVTDGGDDCEDPVSGKDVDLVVCHAMEI